MGYSEYDDETDEVSEGKSGLRSQFEQALKENKILQKELAKLKSQVRETTVAEVLSSKGVNVKIAKFIPSDVEGEEAITAWLEENGDVFGFSTNQTPAADDEPAVKQQSTRIDADEVRRMQSLSQASVNPNGLDGYMQRLANAQSQEEISEIMREAASTQI